MGNVTQSSFFLFMLNLFIHGNFPMSGNQHLLEAFLRSGDLNQAEKFIKAFPSEDLEFITLRSVVAYCQSKQGAFQDLQEYWPQVSKTFKEEGVPSFDYVFIREGSRISQRKAVK